MDELDLFMWQDAPELSHEVLKNICFVCGKGVDHGKNIVLSIGAYCDKHTFADVLEKELGNNLDCIIKDYGNYIRQ